MTPRNPVRADQATAWVQACFTHHGAGHFTIRGLMSSRAKKVKPIDEPRTELFYSQHVALCCRFVMRADFRRGRCGVDVADVVSRKANGFTSCVREPIRDRFCDTASSIAVAWLVARICYWPFA